MSSSSSDDFTTIAVRRESDVTRLDRVNEREFGGEASYRAVINFLVDHYEDDVDADLEALLKHLDVPKVEEGRQL